MHWSDQEKLGMKSTDKTISVKEAMERLKKSDSTIRRYMREGDLHYWVDRQRHIHIFLEDVERLATLDAIEPAENETVSKLQQRIADLEEEVHAQHVYLFQMKERLDHFEEMNRPVVSTPGIIRTKTHAIAPASANNGKYPPLPTGWTSWHGFLSRHGLKSDRWTSVRPDYVKGGEVYRTGSATIQFPMDPAGQRMFILNYRDQITPCDEAECICQSVLGSTLGIEDNAQQ
jgi:hypothetical protein